MTEIQSNRSKLIKTKIVTNTTSKSTSPHFRHQMKSKNRQKATSYTYIK